MNTEEVINHIKNQYSDGIIEVSEFLGQRTVEVKKEQLISILTYLKASGYSVLMDLTAIDYLVPTTRTKIVYWLHNASNLERIRIILYVARNESIPSVTKLWEGADWYERELFDMFGVFIENHPDLKRILMPDDWKGHPLRRDYALMEDPVEFKHGVKPKVPSKIIRYDKSII